MSYYRLRSSFIDHKLLDDDFQYVWCIFEILSPRLVGVYCILNHLSYLFSFSVLALVSRFKLVIYSSDIWNRFPVLKQWQKTPRRKKNFISHKHHVAVGKKTLFCGETPWSETSQSTGTFFSSSLFRIRILQKI